MWESCETLGEMAGRQAAVHQLFINPGSYLRDRVLARTYEQFVSGEGSRSRDTRKVTTACKRFPLPCELPNRLKDTGGSRDTHPGAHGHTRSHDRRTSQPSKPNDTPARPRTVLSPYNRLLYTCACMSLRMYRNERRNQNGGD